MLKHSVAMRLPAKRDWLVAGALFGFALFVYWLSAQMLGRTYSPNSAYFNLLADAFLHGRLYLLNPPATGDLTMYQGRWYVPFPPLPALLMLPWVAVRGVEHANTVLFGAIIGAVNVAMAFLLLAALVDRGWAHLSRSAMLWLTLLFGLGSVHWYMATQGSVWFVSQLCTLTFILLAAWSALATGSALLSGAALAIAMLARPPVALCYVLLLGIGIQQINQHTGARDLRRWSAWALLCLLPLVISGAMLLAYNAARFSNPLDFGYLQQNVARELADDLHTYGQFSLHYVPHNLWAMLLAGPTWDRTMGQIVPDLDGMSLFITTPALVYLFNLRQRSALVLGAALATGLLLIPLITYYNTGWWQFGYRFSLDYMTPVLILLAISIESRVTWKLRILILLGVLVNAWGVWWFQNPHALPFSQFGR